MSATRRASVTSRRRSSCSAPRLLGAVKLQSPLGGGGEAGSPCSSSEPTSAQATPQNQSPPGGRPTCPAAAVAPVAAAAADGLAEFSRQLASSRSADRWLEAQERAKPNSGMQGPQLRHQSLSPLGQQPVELASSQIVHKALRFITDQAPSPDPAGTVGKAAEKPSFDSQTFLDKGMDAISGVGKLMEGFAITLDTVIGHAFEDWGTTLQPGRTGKTAGKLPSTVPFGTSSAAAATQRPAARGTAVATAARLSGTKQMGRQALGNKENTVGVVRAVGKQQQAGQTVALSRQGGAQAESPSSRQPHIDSFMSKLDAASEQEVVEWRRRAQQLATELQCVRAQQEEYQRLRLQYDKLHQDLHQASTVANRLAEENSSLKSRSVDPLVGTADPMVAQQVAMQMEALLTEKSKLVQENDRLLRENTGLQELLEFTLQHHGQLAGDGELFGYDEGEEEVLGVQVGGAAVTDGPVAAAQRVGTR